MRAARKPPTKSQILVAPRARLHRRLLAEGIGAGEFRNIDPVLFSPA